MTITQEEDYHNGKELNIHHLFITQKITR